MSGPPKQLAAQALADGSVTLAAAAVASRDPQARSLGGAVLGGAMRLRLAGRTSLPASATFARNAAASRRTSAQAIEFVAANQPRFDHDAETGAPIGLRIEGSRQSPIRNPVAAGSTVGVLGSGGVLPTNWTRLSTVTGISCEVVGTQVVQGITCLKLRLFGTAGAAGSVIICSESGSTNPATAAQTETWTVAAFIGLSAGSAVPFSNVKSGLCEETSAGALLAQNGTTLNKATLDAGYVGRFPYKRTLSNASTARVAQAFIFDVANGAVVDATFLLALPSIEKATLTSTPTQDNTAIPAEVCSVTLPRALNDGLWVVSGRAPKGQIASTLAQLHDGTANNAIRIRRDTGGNVFATFTVGGVSVADLNLGLWMDDIPGTVAVRWGGSACSACFAGRTEATAAVAGPSGLTTGRIGSDLSGNYWGGTVATFETSRTNAAALSGLTAPSWVHDDFHRADGLPVAPPNSAGLAYTHVQPVASPTAVVVAGIVSNQLVTADSSSTAQTASYMGVDLGPGKLPRRLAARVIFQPGTANNGNVTLISNPNGLDRVTQITGGAPDGNGSAHMTFTDAAAQPSSFDAGVQNVITTTSYGTACARDGATLYRFGWRHIPGTDFYALEHPDGAETVLSSAALSNRIGRYVTFEAFWLEPSALPVVICEVYAEAA